jgi:hypothetical protein
MATMKHGGDRKSEHSAILQFDSKTVAEVDMCGLAEGAA